MAAPYQIAFYSYDHLRAEWVPTPTATHELDRDAEINVISWNLNVLWVGVAARAKAALDHLQQTCEDTPVRTLIILQEVCRRSLDALLRHEWVQRRFAITKLEPPKSITSDIAGPTFVMTESVWESSRHFTIMLVSTDVPIAHGFRVPFMGVIGEDLLVADIPLTKSHKEQRTRDVLRVCNMRFQPTSCDKVWRLPRLALISSVCKGNPLMNCNVVAGLVAGDVATVVQREHEYTKNEAVRLRDAWEDGSKGAIPVRTTNRVDVTNGLAKGYTWGYQNRTERRAGGRRDKILYTGSLEIVPLTGGEQLTRGMRRLGVGLKTTVNAYKREWQYKTLNACRKEVTFTIPSFRSLETEKDPPYNDLQRDDETRVRTDYWVSDHHGISAKFRLVGK